MFRHGIPANFIYGLCNPMAEYDKCAGNISFISCQYVYRILHDDRHYNIRLDPALVMCDDMVTSMFIRNDTANWA